LKDDRRYPKRPIIGVGAIIFDRTLERVLLIERGKEPLKGFWSLPGGVLETGEYLEEAVRREVREETGLEVKVLELFEIFERIMRDRRGRPEYHYVLHDYICRPVRGRLCPGDDCAAARWVRQNEIGNYPMTGGTANVIERAFRKRAGHA
jgi:mutator protein MutT